MALLELKVEEYLAKSVYQPNVKGDGQRSRPAFTEWKGSVDIRMQSQRSRRMKYFNATIESSGKNK